MGRRDWKSGRLNRRTSAFSIRSFIPRNCRVPTGRLAGAVGMVFNTVTVEIAVRELSLVTVSVGPVVDALAVEFPLDEISLVAVATGPVEDTLAGAFVGDPVADVFVSVGPVVGTLAMTLSLDEVALVTVAVRPVVTSFSRARALDEVAFVAVAVDPVINALAGAFVVDPVADVIAARIPMVGTLAGGVSLVKSPSWRSPSWPDGERRLCRCAPADESAGITVPALVVVGTRPVACTLDRNPLRPICVGDNEPLRAFHAVDEIAL